MEQPLAATPTEDEPATASTRPRTAWWRRRTSLAVTAAVGAVVLGVVGGLVGAGIATSAGGGTCDAARTADRTLPSVVTVQASGQRGSGNGSGAVLNANGLVVTNDHVLTPALPQGKIQVMLADGELLDATLVGRDPQTDLAVLRVQRDGALPPIAFSRSDDVRIGQPVVALGAPLGLSNTVTTGIISSLGRSVTLPTAEGGSTIVTGMVQTDASINPGNSGGALVDCRGRLVGINTAISTVPDAQGIGGGGSVGIGFAVPVDTVRTITDQLVAHGRVDHPSFGMTTSTLTAASAQQFGVPPGVVVTGTVPGGSAALAGLQEGDLITKLGEHSAPTDTTVIQLGVSASVGDTVDVTFIRDRQTGRTTVTLRPNPAP